MFLMKPALFRKGEISLVPCRPHTGLPMNIRELSVLTPARRMRVLQVNCLPETTEVAVARGHCYLEREARCPPATGVGGGG